MADPTKPRCPATKIRDFLSMSHLPHHQFVTRLAKPAFLAYQIEVMFNHALHHVPETHAGRPVEKALGFSRIAAQVVHLGRSQIARVVFDAGVPVKFAIAGRQIEKFAYGVRLTGGDDEVIRLRML